MLALLLAVSLGVAPSDAGSESARRILFIGNSLTYTNDLPAIVSALAIAAGNPKPVTRDVVFGGASLEDHWRRGQARAAIAEGGSDFVVLQQGPSALPELRLLLLQYARLFAAEIRKIGATPVLYMVWPSKSRPEDFPSVIESYRQAAREGGGILCPVGEAWQIAWVKDPRLGLSSDDGLHPRPAGSFLAALVIYSVLFGETPQQFPEDLKLPGGVELQIGPDQARTIKESAAEAVARSGLKRQASAGIGIGSPQGLLGVHGNPRLNPSGRRSLRVVGARGYAGRRVLAIARSVFEA